VRQSHNRFGGPEEGRRLDNYPPSRKQTGKCNGEIMTFLHRIK
jgi:hypothetical protein